MESTEWEMVMAMPVSAAGHRAAADRMRPL